MPSDDGNLLQRKTLLLQQMSLLDDRCRSTSDILARRTTTSTHALAESASRESVGARRARREHPATFHTMQPPSSIVKPFAYPVGSEAERLRTQAFMKRTVKSVEHQTRQTGDVPSSRGPSSGVFRKQRVEASMFPVRYTRGELPCAIEHRGAGNGLSWICPLLQLDYEHYLPIFVDGIRCTEMPYSFVARQGVEELIDEAKGFPDCILPCLPHLVRPLRLALNTHDPEILHAGLRTLQKLVMSNFGVGEALVPYHRQLLPVLNLFFAKRQNLGDSIFYGQRKGKDLGTAVLETLEMLEKTGGPGAFASIKYMVPAYESCVR